MEITQAPQPPSEPEPSSTVLDRAFSRGISATRVLMTIPVVVFLLSSVAAFAYGTDVFVLALREVIRHPLPVSDKISYFLIIIDLFLIGATLLISAIGFYELFVSPGGARRAGAQLPSWLDMRDLNDLKARVVAMAVLVLTTTFVEVAVDAAAVGPEVLEVGGGIALMIAALTAFLRFGERRS